VKGSIRQRGKTYTAYWFTNDPGTGKRLQHSRGGFRTRKAAQTHLNEILGKVQEGSWRPDKPLTLRELLLHHWLPAQRSRELRPSTLSQYENVVVSWIVPKLGGVRASSLTPAQVVSFTEQLRTSKTSTGRKGLSPRSAQLAVGVLKSACAWALENGLLARNPIAGVRRPRGESKVMSAWSAEEARSFLTATHDDRLAFAWALLLTRGLRRGELCGLRWSEVDIDGQVLRVTSSRVVVDGTALDSAPKTKAGRRSLPLDAELVALLKTHKARQAKEKLAAGAAYEDDEFLIADELGRSYHPDSVSEWFAEKVKSTGLRPIRLHDCRHTAASLMLAAGEQVKVVSEMLGHSSVTITLNLYAHVMPGMAEKAGERLSATLLG
jgi:integrase